MVWAFYEGGDESGEYSTRWRPKATDMAGGVYEEAASRGRGRRSVAAKVDA